MRESVFPTSDRLTLSETACGSHETGPAAEEVPRRHHREHERRLGVGLGDREFEAVMLPETR